MRPFLIGTMLAFLAVTPAWANVGRIKSASGGAYIERVGQRIAIKPGFVLEKGDVIITPVKGRAGMTFVDNCRLAAGPNSRITISNFDYNDTTHSGVFVADIAKGTVAIVGGLIAKSAPNAMRVKTPKALFAVRGARIVVRVK
ncbi:MAG: hypothetical protein ABL918_01675 [Chakrabartia sp.]